MTSESGSKLRIWWAVSIVGALLAVVGVVVAIVVGVTTGRTFAGTPDDLVAIEEADALLTGMEAGRTFYLYAPDDADIVDAQDPQAATGCKFDGPDLSVYDNPLIDAPIDVGGVVHEPVLTIMNGSVQGADHQGADYTAECEADHLLIGTASSSQEFHVHGAFWPAIVVGGLGLAAAMVGAVALLVLRSTTSIRR